MIIPKEVDLISIIEKNRYEYYHRSYSNLVAVRVQDWYKIKITFNSQPYYIYRSKGRYKVTTAYINNSILGNLIYINGVEFVVPYKEEFCLESKTPFQIGAIQLPVETDLNFEYCATCRLYFPLGASVPTNIGITDTQFNSYIDDEIDSGIPMTLIGTYNKLDGNILPHRASTIEIFAKHKTVLNISHANGQTIKYTLGKAERLVLNNVTALTVQDDNTSLFIYYYVK